MLGRRSQLHQYQLHEIDAKQLFEPNAAAVKVRSDITLEPPVQRNPLAEV